MKNDITITGRGIVISRHASGVIFAYDSRHRIVVSASLKTNYLYEQDSDNDAGRTLPQPAFGSVDLSRWSAQGDQGAAE